MNFKKFMDKLDGKTPPSVLSGEEISALNMPSYYNRLALEYDVPVGLTKALVGMFLPIGRSLQEDLRAGRFVKARAISICLIGGFIEIGALLNIPKDKMERLIEEANKAAAEIRANALATKQKRTDT